MATAYARPVVPEGINLGGVVVESRGRRQGTEITYDEIAGAIGAPPAQLRDRFGGDVQPDQVESGVEQRARSRCRREHTSGARGRQCWHGRQLGCGGQVQRQVQ
ncbi:MAG: hypothetical protein M3Y48_02745 [Actinomycetota bacterium]|nr:hypothetical protein [Actinomycetota bacterium]